MWILLSRKKIVLKLITCKTSSKWLLCERKSAIKNWIYISKNCFIKVYWGKKIVWKVYSSNLDTFVRYQESKINGHDRRIPFVLLPLTKFCRVVETIVAHLGAYSRCYCAHCIVVKKTCDPHTVDRIWCVNCVLIFDFNWVGFHRKRKDRNWKRHKWQHDIHKTQQ